jgi:exopolyphosphatase/guanosine-5'-triphosphate,3'-diphosphate pyrophosphatase
LLCIDNQGMSITDSSVAPLASRWPGLLAAIDLGSNSFRLEIGQVLHGRYRRQDYLKETVRLGGGLDGNGLLTEEAALRGLECLARFQQRLAGFTPQQVRAVATQTLREARNRDAFLVRARTVLGHPIEVISGREEARLIFSGVARLQPSLLPRLVVDIGGRSTEMILGQGRRPAQAESFQVGSVSLSMRYFSEGRFTEQAFRDAQVAAGAELEEALEPFARSRWVEALGSSGTVSAVSQLLSGNGVTDGSITPEGLRWLMDRCLQAGRAEKLNLTGLRDDRRAVIGGGLSILLTLAQQFGVTQLQATRGALRQGVILDLDERLQAASLPREGHDIRVDSVGELQRRFAVDMAQAERVTRVALALYDSVFPQAEPEARRELQWACSLHEMGMMVSHHDHHRHSAYLLGHVDAPGFSQSQQRRIGELVLGQRGGLRKVENSLTVLEFAWQVLCLRLAVIKCHARGEVSESALTLRRLATQAVVGFEAGWAERNPRTLHLLTEEAALWERAGPLRIALKP